MQRTEPTGADPSAEPNTPTAPGLTSASPLWFSLPCAADVCDKLRVLISSGKIRINEIVDLALSDPILTLELLSASNKNEKGEVPEILTLRSGFFRLGSEGVVQLLDEIVLRKRVEDPQASAEFEKLRVLGRRTSVVAELIAAATHREHLEDARTIGLFTVIGQMLACMKLGRKYAELAGEFNRPALVYRLSQDHRFDVKNVQLNYLKSRLIPQDLFYVFDREFTCKAPGQASLRFIVDAAVELVEAFDLGRIERYSPSAQLPTKSALRLLGLTTRQHEALYEDAILFFKGKKGADAPKEEPATPTPVVVAESVQPLPESSLAEVGVPEIDYIEAGENTQTSNPIPFSDKAQTFFVTLENLFRTTPKTEDLLSQLLTILVGDGPFQRAALLVLQTNRTMAVINAVAGDAFPAGQSVVVKDPVSPLALCTTKIRSFNTKKVVDLQNPFGVTAYALSPIKVKGVPPVVLYVDCGDQKCLPFEGRKIFRLVVGLLNNALSQSPEKVGLKSASTSL